MLQTMSTNVEHIGGQGGVGRNQTTVLRSSGNRRTSHDALEIRIAVLGTLGVGKSALVVKYITKRFIMEYDPLLEDVYSKTESFDGREVIIRLMDTSDSDEKSADRYLRWAHAFVVVFSITCRSSFDDAGSYLDTIARYQQETGKELPVVLVGNKSDLERYRTVSKSTADDLASKFDCFYLETSAAEDLGSVIHVFHGITRDVIRSRDLQLSMQSLFISEERSSLHTGALFTLPAVGGGGGGGHSPMGAKRQGHNSKVKDAQKDAKDVEKKEDSKLVHRRPTTSFKLFNKSFKIFN